MHIENNEKNNKLGKSLNIVFNNIKDMNSINLKSNLFKIILILF